MPFHPYKEIEPELIEYVSLLALARESGITWGVGTDYEVTVPTELIPTLDEWRRDPGLIAWRGRVPPHIAEAWERLRDARYQQVEETMAMFDDDDGSAPGPTPKIF
jgi:hypothetical protein